MAEHYRTGPDQTVERPAIGRRSSECQVDCVNLLIPGPVTLVAGATSRRRRHAAHRRAGGVGARLPARRRHGGHPGRHQLPGPGGRQQPGHRAARAGSGRPSGRRARPPAGLLGADDSCRRCAGGSPGRCGTAPCRWMLPGLAEHLRATVVNQIAIDQPKYSGFQTRWPTPAASERDRAVPYGKRGRRRPCWTPWRRAPGVRAILAPHGLAAPRLPDHRAAAVLPLTLFSCLFGGLLALPWTYEEGWRLMLVTYRAGARSRRQQPAERSGGLAVGWTGRTISGCATARIRWRWAAAALDPRSLLALTGAWRCSLACWCAGAPAVPGLLAGRGRGPAAVVLYLAAEASGPGGGGGISGVGAAHGGRRLLGGERRLGPGDRAAVDALFGLGPTVVVLAKHADKRRDDAARGIRTLAVILGPRWGPGLTAALALIQISWGVGWAWGASRWAYLLLLAACRRWCHWCTSVPVRGPVHRPKGYPASLWPLWYTAAGFRFARASGLALVECAPTRFPTTC
jgi:hypothetical protein